MKMELTEKEKAIRAVLEKRSECCEMGILAQKKEIARLEEEIAKRKKQIDYLDAKRQGYEQAIDLFGESLESIRIEL